MRPSRHYIAVFQRLKVINAWLLVAGLWGVTACDSPVKPQVASYTIGGAVSGLAGSGLKLANNGGDTLAVSTDGPVTFASALEVGTNYHVTVVTHPANPEQACVVSSGSGTVGTANVTNVGVSCFMAGAASPVLVSSPVPEAAIRASHRFAARRANDLVYVSLPPGAIPGGFTASISDLGTSSSITTQMVDGGFDPVPLPADEGDSLVIAIRGIGGGAPTSFLSVVAAAKPPTVVRTNPPSHKRDVSLNAIVVIVFSEPLDPGTTDTASIKLWLGTIPVSGTVNFADAAHLRVEFHPDSLLQPQTDYQLVITTTVTDLHGLALDSAITIPFTTGTTVPPTNLVFASVSVGFTHACGVTTAGVAYCWGDNYTGSLGDGTMWTTGLSPVPVAGGLTFASVSASAFHTCGVTTTGAAYCWGEGSLGDGSGNLSLVPVAVAGGLTFASVSAGSTHNCGVTTGGAAYCWGGNYYGELGDGTRSFAPTPVPVAGGLTFAQVSADGNHSCGVTTSGAGYCWGQNTMGELGVGTSTGPDQCQNGGSYACSTVPVAVAGGLTFRSISSASVHSCGVTTNGTPYCWGDNLHDLLGSGTNANGSDPQPTGPEQCVDTLGISDWGPSVLPCSTIPVPVAGGLNLAALTTGGQDWFACGITTTGLASCWGGGRGLSYLPATTAPLPVAGGLHFATLSAGLWSTCGVTPAGVAYCWGSGGRGELGTGNSTGSDVPVKVAGQP